MFQIQAQTINELPAGSRLTINDRAYMRLVDQDVHGEAIRGWIVDIETGWMGPWSRLCLLTDMVTVRYDATRQRSELEEALLELDGVVTSVRSHMNGAGGHWATIVHVEQAQARLRGILNGFGTKELKSTEGADLRKPDGPNA